MRMHIPNSTILAFSLFIFAFCQFSVADEEGAEVELKPALVQCTRRNACGATLSTYPLLESEPDESSGFGSGMAPVYDEILTHEIFDLNAAPETQNFTMCSCPNDATCDFESEENAIKVDYHVTLRFCNLVDIPKVCKRKDVNVRIIGAAHAAGDSVSEVSQAMVFCNCPSGFARQQVESWSGNDISLNYKCM